MKTNIDPKMYESDLKKVAKREETVERGEPIFNRLRNIKKLIQLVQLANNCSLIPREVFPEALERSFILGEFTNHPTKSILILPGCKDIFSYLGRDRKYKFRYIQKISYEFINQEGYGYNWYHVYFRKLYLEFINLKDKNELADFIKKTGFCVFPSMREFEFLKKKYCEAGIDEVAVFDIEFNKSDSAPWLEEWNEDRKNVIKINLDFIWSKKERFADYVKKYQSGDLNLNNILFLNQQMENVTDALSDAESFPAKNVAHRSVEKMIKDMRKTEDVIGHKKVQDFNLVPHYRIYGHFALCVFELYLDFLDKIEIKICANKECEKYFKPKRKGQEYCGHKECTKQRNAQRSKKKFNKNKK